MTTELADQPTDVQFGAAVHERHLRLAHEDPLRHVSA
mgnify:CR=1 FL=1